MLAYPSMSTFHHCCSTPAEMIWLVLFATATAVTSASEVTVGDEWVNVIENKLYEEETTWKITTDSGSKIRVICLDFRFPTGDTNEASCKWANVTFDDGTTKKNFCGTNYWLDVTGESNTLTIDIVPDRGVGGFVECYAKSSHQPKSYEEITVNPGAKVVRIEFPEKTRQSLDKAWRFKSSTDKKISLQCETRMEGESNEGACFKDTLTVDDGNGPVQFCGYRRFVSVSAGTEITMRFESFLDTEATIDCKVQGISGDKPNEFENIQEPSEDESAEHGVAPGSKSTTCDCGKANKAAGRIINGTETNEGKYPFMVSMRYPGGGHFCGASIISAVHILTAAHCVSDRWTKNEPTPANLEPVVGAHRSWEDASHGETQRLKVKDVFIPKEWFATKGSLAGDIAILHLDTPIKFSKWVTPVCLTPNEPDIINKYIKAIGWGTTESGSLSDPLLEANVQVLDPSLCNQNEKETCFRTGHSSSCYGDSGGPFVYADPETNRYTQVALVSYGYGNFCNGAYFIGTNVVHWYDWIQNTMASTSSSHSICKKAD